MAYQLYSCCVTLKDWTFIVTGAVFEKFFATPYINLGLSVIGSTVEGLEVSYSKALGSHISIVSSSKTASLVVPMKSKATIESPEDKRAFPVLVEILV